MENFDVLNEKGEFTGKIESRENCHKNGLWHRAVYGVILNKNGDVLLQKRSKDKKLYPNLCDATVGGHILAGELSYQALIREIKEEIGINVNEQDIKYLMCTIDSDVTEDIVNNHFNDGYIIIKDIDIEDIKLQEEEVSDIRWFTKQEIYERINNNYNGITPRSGVWKFLKICYEKGGM